MGYILPHSDLFLSQDLILSWGRCSVCINVFISAFICFIKKKHLLHLGTVFCFFFICPNDLLMHYLITSLISTFFMIWKFFSYFIKWVWCEGVSQQMQLHGVTIAVTEGVNIWALWYQVSEIHVRGNKQSLSGLSGNTWDEAVTASVMN